MWLLEQRVIDAIQTAKANGFTPSAHDRECFEEFSMRATGRQGAIGDRILSIEGGIATITVSGALSAKPDIFAMLFGGGNTTYGEIEAALDAAAAEDRIEKVQFLLDTPGGEGQPLFSLMDKLKSFPKPTEGIVTKAASAGFGIAASLDEVKAVNRGSMVGSVGVVVEMLVHPNLVSVTSTEAPNKRPDLSTEDGKAALRESLDQMHQLFAEYLAEGRGTTVDKVNAEFGRGATLLADDALKRGMIDAIISVQDKPKPKPAAASGMKTTEVSSMDLNELKTKHPETYAAAVQLGRDEGIESERDRVMAHLDAGKDCGALDIALKSIEEGAGMTQRLMVKYARAGMNNHDREDQQNATDTASAVVDGSDGSEGLAEEARENMLALQEAAKTLGYKIEV